MSSSQKGARGRALQDLSVPLFLRSLSRIHSSSKYIREKLTAQMRREYRSGSTDARECVVLKHAAAKVTLQACEKSVYQSGFLYKVVVMSDANLGSKDDSGDESGPHARGEQLVTPPVTAGRSRAQRGVTRKLSTVSASDPRSKEPCSVLSRETNPGLHVQSQPYFNYC